VPKGLRGKGVGGTRKVGEGYLRLGSINPKIEIYSSINLPSVLYCLKLGLLPS
jgi:hypothetical protein